MSGPSPLARLGLALVQFYRYVLSPMFPASCRFEPTCSAYALQALRDHGALRGGWLAVRRMARCYPYGGMGYDPAPPPRAEKQDKTSTP